MTLQLLYQIKALIENNESSQENGQGLIEYGLIILLIAMVVMGVVGLFGEQLRDIFNQISNQIPSP